VLPVITIISSIALLAMAYNGPYDPFVKTGAGIWSSILVSWCIWSVLLSCVAALYGRCEHAMERMASLQVQQASNNRNFLLDKVHSIVACVPPHS